MDSVLRVFEAPRVMVCVGMRVSGARTGRWGWVGDSSVEKGEERGVRAGGFSWGKGEMRKDDEFDEDEDEFDEDETAD